MESRGGYHEAQSTDWVVIAKSIANWVIARSVPFLAIVVVVSSVAFFVLFYFLCHFQSEGFLRAARPLTEFNAQRAAFQDRASLLRYLQASNLVDDPNAQYLLHAIGPAMVQKLVKPILPYSKDDLKYLSDLKGEDANLLGFNISMPAKSADDAAARVKLMGEYMRDSMLRMDLTDSILFRAGEAKAHKQTLDNKLIAKQLELDDATNKLNALKAIAAKYPEASKFESRQLLSSDNDSSKFLSPMMQLVGIESNIADLHLDIASLERDIAQNALRLRFYSGAEKLAATARSGKELLGKFEQLEADTFKSMDLEDSQVREVANKIRLLANSLEAKHLTDTRFVSGPTVPPHRSGPSSSVLAFLALLAGSAIAAIAIASAEAWQRYKARSSFSVPVQSGAQI